MVQSSRITVGSEANRNSTSIPSILVMEESPSEFLLAIESTSKEKSFEGEEPSTGCLTFKGLERVTEGSVSIY